MLNETTPHGTNSIYNSDNILDFLYIIKKYTYQHDKKGTITNIYASFDIETTNTDNGAYMYAWTYSIGTQEQIITYEGRTWQEFIDLLQSIKQLLPKYSTLICGIYNISFEFQFMRTQYTEYINKIFAREKRDIFYFDMLECFRFLDLLKLSGTSLEETANIYKTPHKKLVGDLDYTKPRSYKTALTRTEWGYIDNDTIICVEFLHILYNRLEYIPLTKTGIVRKRIKEGSKEQKTPVKNAQATFPISYERYNNMMQYLYSGGVSQSNRYFINLLLDFKMCCYDIKSSYPFQMLTRSYPTGKPIKREYKPHDIGYHYIMVVTIKDIKIKDNSPFCVLSKHKMLATRNAKYFNGRLFSADEITVYINEIDFEIIKDTYDFTTYEISQQKCYKSAMLPSYVTKPLLESFKIKESTSKKTVEYKLAKENVNSQYGCMVTRLAVKEYTLAPDGTIQYDRNYKFDYNKEVKKSFLSPLWGIYVTSYAREQLIKISNKIGVHDAIYTDTDSIYMRCTDRNKSIIDDFNNKVIEYNKSNLPDYCRYIGTFENETPEGITRFKTLGSKRYIKEIDGIPHVTIAGLPTGSLENYAKVKGKDIFEVFQPDLYMKEMDIKKNKHTYYDIPHTAIIDGVEMMEYSSIVIEPTKFQIKHQNYMDFIINKYLESYDTKYDRAQFK